MRLPPELLRWLAFRPRRAGKDAKQTFFFHIPKCAGTSVWASLYDIYGTRYVYLVNSDRRRRAFAAMPQTARHGYSAVGGHAPLRYFREYLDDAAGYHKIVTLRDPIDRTISGYNYIRAQVSHPRNAEVAALSLDEFAARVRPNRQVRLLTGKGDDVEGAIDIVTRFFDDWAFSDGVGALVQRLYRIAGTAPRNAVHKNKGASGPRRADLGASTLRLLEDRNRNDLALIAALEKQKR